MTLDQIIASIELAKASWDVGRCRDGRYSAVVKSVIAYGATPHEALRIAAGKAMVQIVEHKMGVRMGSFYWGELAVDRSEGEMIVLNSYGWTIGSDCTVMGLVAGDQGFDATHITIPRDHILALVEDWPEVTVHKMEPEL